MRNDTWQRAADPDVLQLILNSSPTIARTKRKLNLFGCACLSDLRLQCFPSDMPTKGVLVSLEKRLDGDPKDVVRHDAEEYLLRSVPDDFKYFFRLLACPCLSIELFERNVWSLASLVRQVDRPDAGRRQCRALRDIFQNPVEPVEFDPKWRTDATVGMARTIYEKRDFRAVSLGVLHDALLEAHCNHPGILEHLQEPDRSHVRGCWVIDLVLGRT